MRESEFTSVAQLSIIIILIFIAIFFEKRAQKRSMKAKAERIYRAEINKKGPKYLEKLKRFCIL